MRPDDGSIPSNAGVVTVLLLEKACKMLQLLRRGRRRRLLLQRPLRAAAASQRAVAERAGAPAPQLCGDHSVLAAPAPLPPGLGDGLAGCHADLAFGQTGLGGGALIRHPANLLGSLIPNVCTT